MWGIPLDPKPEEKDDDEETDETIDESTKAGIHMFEKMEDVELVLRFFAYRKIGEFKAGLNKISEFLDRFIVAGNKFPDEGLREVPLDVRGDRRLPLGRAGGRSVHRA